MCTEARPPCAAATVVPDTERPLLARHVGEAVNAIVRHRQTSKRRRVELDTGMKPMVVADATALRKRNNHLTVKHSDSHVQIKSPTAADSEDAPEEPRKRPTFRQIATAVCGNVKFRRQKKAGPLDRAQMELSFHRTVSKSSVCTLAGRLRRSLPKFGEIQ
eukprot:s1734_g1.t1